MYSYLFNFNIVCKYVQLETQCGKNLSAWSLWSCSKFDKPWAEEAISPTGAVEQMRQFQRPPDQCSLYGAWKASRFDLKGSKFRKFSGLRADWLRLRSLCTDLLAYHDEIIHAVTVIHLNLNPPFKNPRSPLSIFQLSKLLSGSVALMMNVAHVHSEYSCHLQW